MKTAHSQELEVINDINKSLKEENSFIKELNELLAKYNLAEKRLIKGDYLYIESSSIDNFIVIGNENNITLKKIK